MNEGVEPGFAGAVAWYDRYRLAYPDRLIARVVCLAGLKPGDAVLDLGCGTGMLALAFARAGLAVTAMDPEPAMLDKARSRAQAEGLALTFRQGGSENLEEGMGPFRLAVMGRAFHWMDRTATLSLLAQIVTRDGGVALFHDAHPPVEENGWFKVLCDVQARYRRDRRGGHRRYEPFLFASAFTEIDSLSVVIRQELTMNDIVGRAFSMSGCSPQGLGTAREEFAQTLSAALRELSPDGKFVEVAEMVAVLARRPRR